MLLSGVYCGALGVEFLCVVDVFFWWCGGCHPVSHVGDLVFLRVASCVLPSIVMCRLCCMYRWLYIVASLVCSCAHCTCVIWVAVRSLGPYRPSDLTATQCQSSRKITGAKHRNILAVSPALFNSSIIPCYPVTHSDYTGTVRATPHQTSYNIQPPIHTTQHSRHITIEGSTQDATRRKTRSLTWDTGWQPPHHQKNTPTTHKNSTPRAPQYTPLKNISLIK